MDERDHHHHDHPLGEMACQLVRFIHDDVNCASGVVILERSGTPHASLYGNETAFALMVRALLEAALRAGRPTECLNCMENYDRMTRAIAALDEIVGQC